MRTHKKFIDGAWADVVFMVKEEAARDTEELIEAERAATNTAAAEVSKILTKLREIDMASVRALREYISAQPDAPKIIKDREAEAITEREKLR